jgi:hypothetical protein
VADRRGNRPCAPHCTPAAAATLWRSLIPRGWTQYGSIHQIGLALQAADFESAGENRQALSHAAWRRLSLMR